MVNQDHGVTVRDQVVHDPVQTDDVGRVQSDGGFVQDIQDSCGAVSDSPGKLHPLALSGGQGGRCAVQSKVAESQIQEALCHGPEGFTDAFCHRAHLFRE